MDPINLEIGQRIMEIRTQKGWSRKFLASKAGITEQFLLYVEGGKRGLSSHTIRNFSLALNVTADYLLFGNAETKQRHDYASQAFANLSDEEHENTLKLFDSVSELFRRYK